MVRRPSHHRFKIMGNGNSAEGKKSEEPASASGNIVVRAFQTLSFEYNTGKMLVKAIIGDSRDKVDEAVEYARRELLKPRTGGVANTRSFADVNAALIKYLTQDTDIGDGPLFTQKPLDFCKSRRPPSLSAHEAISEHLRRLRKLAGQADVGGRDSNGSSSSNEGGGTGVGGDRAALAKERLKAFQEGRRRESD